MKEGLESKSVGDTRSLPTTHRTRGARRPYRNAGTLLEALRRAIKCGAAGNSGLSESLQDLPSTFLGTETQTKQILQPMNPRPFHTL